MLDKFFVVVPEGYKGCVIKANGKVRKKWLEPGRHLKIPFWWKKVELVRVQMQELDYRQSGILALTFDHKEVFLKGNLLYQLEEVSPQVYSEKNLSQVEEFVKRILFSRIRMLVSLYESGEIFRQRSSLENNLRLEIDEELTSSSVSVKGCFIEEILPAAI